MTYEIIDVKPDSAEWEVERMSSLGASDIAGVMGLSEYQTPLDVYKNKLGVGVEFPPELAFFGHASENVIEGWVENKALSGLDVKLEPGFMARSTEYPFIHATFDRISREPFTIWEFKTAGAYTAHKWDEGIPDSYRVQAQTQMLVAGTSRVAVVVWIGGREMRVFWEARDDDFINNHLIPAAEKFWFENVAAKTPPEPTTIGEVNAIISREVETELSDEAFDVLERITVLNSDIKAQEKERDTLKVALAQYVGDAALLTHEGNEVATWRSQKGRSALDMKKLRADHADLLTQYTTQGAPFRVLRRKKEAK